MIPMEPQGTTRPGGPTPPATPPSRRGEAAGVEGRGASPPAPLRADEVAFSPRAEEFRRVRSHLDGLPDTVSDRVAQLRALVERGVYAVDGERVAAAMLRDEATARLLGLGAPS